MQSRRRSGRIGGGSLPQEDCMGYATILGLDLGKFKSVCCVMDAGTGSHTFQTLSSTPAMIHDLLTRYASIDTGDEGDTGDKGDSGVLLVIETCDVAGWVHDIAVALGVPVAIATPRMKPGGGRA